MVVVRRFREEVDLAGEFVPGTDRTKLVLGRANPDLAHRLANGSAGDAALLGHVGRIEELERRRVVHALAVVEVGVVDAPDLVASLQVRRERGILQFAGLHGLHVLLRRKTLGHRGVPWDTPTRYHAPQVQAFEQGLAAPIECRCDALPGGRPGGPRCQRRRAYRRSGRGC